MKAVLRLASLTSCPSLWLASFPRDVDPIRQNAKIKVTVVYCNIRHVYMCCKGLQVNPYQKQCQYSPNTVPPKLGYKGFEISDCFILVNDPEVTESCNNGQLFPILRRSYDYLEVIKDGRKVGKYWGSKTGKTILLNGDQILIKFHSDKNIQGRGFLIHFTVGPYGKYFS